MTDVVRCIYILVCNELIAIASYSLQGPVYGFRMDFRNLLRITRPRHETSLQGYTARQEGRQNGQCGVCTTAAGAG